MRGLKTIPLPLPPYTLAVYPQGFLYPWQSLDDEAVMKQREKLAKLEKENAAMKIKLAKVAKSKANGKISVILI